MKAKLTIALLVSLLGFNSAQAETKYVTDVFKVTMRSGETSGHKILRMLPSGTSLEVLSTNAASGYSNVRTSGGTEGYILTHELMDQPSARNQAASLQSRLDELQSEPDKLSSRLATLQQEHATLTQAHEKLQMDKNTVQSELERIQRTAANSVRISNERNELRKNVADLTRELEDLKQENRDLSTKTKQNWFLIGAGVIIAGVLLGLVLPHLRFQRRKSSWGSL